MTAALIAAAAAFLASLAGALALGRAGRDRLGFAALVAAPLLAAIAYAGVVALPAGPATAPAATAAAPPPAAAPAGDLRQQAERARGEKRYADARDAFARIVAADPGDADAWADLADATAAAAGGNLEAGADAIDHALAVDPNHLKALWLKASLELQAKRYDKSIALWQRLLARLPKDSSDARVVNANIEEARALAARQGAGG